MRPYPIRLPAAVLLALVGAGPAAAQQSPGAGMVDEAVREAERAQREAGDIVERMSEEAAKAVEGAPSGAEAVGSTAPPAQASARTPSGGAGLSLRAMIDRPVADRDGEPAGTVRDVLLGAEGGGALVLVEEAGGGAVRAVNAARVLPAPEGGGGLRVDLDRESMGALPGYRREGEGWRLEE